jgi:mono/diheme cytochrome c family protein
MIVPYGMLPEAQEKHVLVLTQVMQIPDIYAMITVRAVGDRTMCGGETMILSIKSNFQLLLLGAVFGCGMLATALPSNAQEETAGANEYRISCASCHGLTGKGDGPLAQYLTVKPANLTVLSKNNNGDFPYLEVFQTIDGRTVVSGHGDRMMPVWGNRYEVEAGVEPGTYASETIVRGRVLELVDYIQSIQLP